MGGKFQERVVMLGQIQVALIVQDHNRTSIALEETSTLLQFAHVLLTMLSTQLLVLVYQSVEMERSKQEKDVTLALTSDAFQTALDLNKTLLAQEETRQRQRPVYAIKLVLVSKDKTVNQSVGMDFCMEWNPVTMEVWEDVPQTV
jgi:hypothetical protein